MAGANVESVFRLVDMFSGPAKAISASMTGMVGRMKAVQAAATHTAHSLNGMMVGIGAMFAAHELHHFAKEAAEDEHLHVRYERMFEKVKKTIGVKKSEIDKMVGQWSAELAIRPEELEGKMVTPLIQRANLQGANLLRAMQLAKNMAAEKGGGAQALEEESSKIATLMAVPAGRGLMRAAREMGQAMGLEPEQMKKLKTLGKHAKNLKGIQDTVLKVFESRFAGAGDLFKDSDLTRMRAMEKGFGDLGIAAGKAVLAVAHAGTDSDHPFSGSLSGLASEIEMITQNLEHGHANDWGKIFRRFSNEGTAFKVVVSGIGLAVAALLAKFALFVAITLWPFALFAAAAVGIYLLYTNWEKFKASIEGTRIGAVLEAMNSASDRLAATFSKLGDIIYNAFSGVDSKIASLTNFLGITDANPKLNGVIGKPDTGLTDSGKSIMSGLSSVPGLDFGIETLKNLFSSPTMATNPLLNIGSYIMETNKAESNMPQLPSFTAPEAAAQQIPKVNIPEVQVPPVNVPKQELPQQAQETLKAFGGPLHDMLMSIFGPLKEVRFPKAEGGTEEAKKMMLSAEALPPLKVDPAKLDINNKVSGEININIKDPGNNASVSTKSAADVILSVGKTNSGSYSSTNITQATQR